MRKNSEFNNGIPKNKKVGIKRDYGKKLLFLVVLTMAVFAILMSPLFYIKDITITGKINKFSEEEIKELAQIKEGNNLFSINKSASINRLKQSPYIDKVIIKKKYPSSINIEILERMVRGYVPYMGSYLYIDEYGRILEVKSSFTEPLPVVTGLDFDSFKLGEKIEAKNPEAFSVMVIIAQIMTKYEMLDVVVKIDVSDVENITAQINNIDVKLGEITNFDEKIRTMSEIVKQIPKEDKGSLDLSDLSKPLVFKYLT